MLQRPCASQEGGSMFLRREEGFLRRGRGRVLKKRRLARGTGGGLLLQKGGGLLEKGGGGFWKSVWKVLSSRKWNWRGMPTILGVNFGHEFCGPTILGVNFGREFFWGAWSPGETRPRNSLNKKIADEFAKKYAGNLPKIRQTNIKFALNPLCGASPAQELAEHQDIENLNGIY